MNGMMNMIFSPAADQIPQNVWQVVFNSVVENLSRRRRNKLGYYEPEEAKGVTLGSASNFQKLTFFKSQVKLWELYSKL